MGKCGSGEYEYEEGEDKFAHRFMDNIALENIYYNGLLYQTTNPKFRMKK